MDFRRIVIAGGVIIAVVAGISFGLAMRDPSLAPDVDWSAPAALPSPTRSDLRSEFVSDEQGFRFFPSSGHLEPNVAYVFDTGHVASGISPTSTAASGGPSTRPARADSSTYS